MGSCSGGPHPDVSSGATLSCRAVCRLQPGRSSRHISLTIGRRLGLLDERMRALAARRGSRMPSLVVISVLVTLAATACEYFGKAKAKNEAPAPPPPVVQVIETTPRDVMVQSEWVAQTYSQE